MGRVSLALLGVPLLFFGGSVPVGSSVPVVDPWIFPERYDLYHTLIDATALPTLFGSDNLGNVLWGFLLQMEWQHASGRLLEPPQTQTKLKHHAQPSDKIKPNPKNLAVSPQISGESWWGGINYYLSVVPYLAAMEVGLVPEVIIQPPHSSFNRTNFCLVAADCDPLMIRKWINYFQFIKSLRLQPEDGRESHNAMSMEKSSPAVALDQALTFLWEIHSYSIKSSYKNFGTEFNFLSRPEQRFGNGWVIFGEMIARSRFNPNFRESTRLIEKLPYRILAESDTAPFIADMTKDMNIIVYFFWKVSDLEGSVFEEAVMNGWKNAMETAKCREKTARFVETFFTRPVRSALKLLLDLARKCR